MADSLVGAIFGVGADMLSDMEIVVVATLAIAVEFVAGEAYPVDALTDVMVGAVSTIDVDMLANENDNGLAAVMTLSEFTLPPP